MAIADKSAPQPPTQLVAISFSKTLKLTFRFSEERRAQLAAHLTTINLTKDDQPISSRLTVKRSAKTDGKTGERDLPRPVPISLINDESQRSF